jgi:hypothetical protein
MERLFATSRLNGESVKASRLMRKRIDRGGCPSLAERKARRKALFFRSSFRLCSIAKPRHFAEPFGAAGLAGLDLRGAAARSFQFFNNAFLDKHFY